MTGMKEGAGEDPFADDESSVAEEQEHSADEALDERETSSKTELHEPRDPSSRQIQIPYKFRRDGVQEGRDRVPLFLQSETKTAERDALREMEERFDDSVSLTDLREALVKAGLDNLDEVESYLEEWGYGMTFDE